MNNYFVVATAKHMLNLRGKQYKIGDAIPTELTEKEYNFYKDALNVESACKSDCNTTVDLDILISNSKKTIGNTKGSDNYRELLVKALERIEELESKSNNEKMIETPKGFVTLSEYEKLKEEYNKLLKKDIEMLSVPKQNSVVANFATTAPVETEIKLKRPYTKKVKEDV